MIMTYKERFITLVTVTKKYYNQIVDKMENFFNTDLDVMCEYPSTILDMLEKESNRKWTDEIWNVIYSSEDSNFDAEMLYETMIKLPEVKI